MMAVEELAAQSKVKRTRKTHSKVRTGCQTCKIRRKKCDETKPFCIRCTSTGRKCDGYTTQLTPPKSDPGSSPDSLDAPATKKVKTNAKVAIPSLAQKKHRPLGDDEYTRLVRPPSDVQFESDQDFFCFDFFRCRTGPEFAAYFDSSIWRSFIMRACFLHPTVLAAGAAVGAAHRRFELGISRQAFEYCDISNRLYQRALRKLTNELSNGNPNASEINMMTVMLFSIYETFQGNYDLAVKHFTAGLKGLLGSQTRTTHRNTQYRTVDLSYNNLRKLLLKLELESVRLFSSSANILSDPEAVASIPTPVSEPNHVWGSLDMVPDPNPYPIPRAFVSLCEARDVLFTEAKWIWHTWSLMEQGLTASFTRQQTHISRLLQWSMAYAEYSKLEVCRRRPQDKQAAQLLKIYREASYLILLTQMAFHQPDTGALIVPKCDPPETCDCHRSCQNFAERKEALNAHFARILVLSEAIFNSSSFFQYEEHSLTVDSGIGPPLYLGATKCRSTKVRHQVTSLLEKSEIQRRVWDTLGVYTIAEKLSSIEEHAVVNCGVVPAYLDPKWVDITFLLEKKQILLRYCRADDDQNDLTGRFQRAWGQATSGATAKAGDWSGHRSGYPSSWTTAGNGRPAGCAVLYVLIRTLVFQRKTD